MTLPDEEQQFDDEENTEFINDFDDDESFDLTDEEEQLLFPEED